MKESESGTGYNVTAPLLVESYQAANKCYTSGGDLSIASPIYKMQGDSVESKIFPYHQIIRGDGGCYLNAALVGILNRCVNDQEKWQQFKENVINNYVFAKEIIEGIEKRAINKKDDDKENGLDRAKLNEILQEKGNDNLATQLSKKIITHLHNDWIKEYENKIEFLNTKLKEKGIQDSAQEGFDYYLKLNEKYKKFLEQAPENEFAEQYEESVLVGIAEKLIDKTGITTISTIGKEMMRSINQNLIDAKEFCLLEDRTIYLSNTEGNHFNLLYGIKDPIIQELEVENHIETRKREDKKKSDKNKRQELLRNINTIISPQQQQEGKAPDKQGQIANIQHTINDILQGTELNNATLAQLSLINDIYEDKIKKIQVALKEKLNKKFPQFKQEQEDKRRASIIIIKQATIYSDFFDQNGVIKQDKKDRLKGHIGEGIDWWVFPGYTKRDDADKNTATEEVYDILSKNPSYCQKYKTFIYQYIAAFDGETEITHKIRFDKLVESLTRMTAYNTRILAGFTQKDQDLLFIAVQNFNDRIGYKCNDTNYDEYFKNLRRIADESKEINHHIWLDEARANLRDRLKLEPGERDSNQIQAKTDDYQPVFKNGDNLNQSQKDDFNKRSQPYCEITNPTGCGTFEGKISSKNVKYPFIHFRLTHDPISQRDNGNKPDKLTRISDEEYLKYPPVAAICIDYPDHRHSNKLPEQETLKDQYKQKTLETLILYNKLKVDHLVKHGDGMGVFLKQAPTGERSQDDIKNAMSAYLDGFFEAVAEFYNQNLSATLQKITCPILDNVLEELFKQKLAKFKERNPDIGKKITPDKAGPRFNITKYYIQGAQKLGMTIAPHENHEFLGGVLYSGNVLEEQVSSISDAANIGNSKCNSNVKKEFSIQSPEIAEPRFPLAPSTTVDKRSNFKKEDYVTTKEKIFYHTNGHSNGKRKTYKENIIEDEGQRKAGAYHNSTKETHEVLNDILQSVIDAAKSTSINDKEKLIKILIEATKKGTVKGDPQAKEEVKKFSALFQKNCKNKNIFSAQDCKTGLRTKRFGDVFGGIKGISTAIDIHIIAKDSELSLNKITEQASVLQIDPNPLART